MKETVDFSKLINDAISGDNRAFDELYQLTHKTAYHTASLLLKNHDDVEDVLQNAYIKAYKKLPELKNHGSFEGWIKTIVENECKNYIKKEKRVLAPVIFFKNKATENAEEWKQPVPQEYMEREELRKSVSDILDRLSPETRACIVLFHYEEKSLIEISETLNIPVGTVKSRLHNGRKQIEKEFNKLRKKDPTLLGLGAIPALLSLLSYQSKNIAVPAAVSETVISSAIGTTAATGAASSAGGAAATTVTAASTAAGGVASTAAASIAVKVAAVAVAGSVAVGGSVAIKNHVEKKAAEESTAAYSSALPKEETGTLAETLTEVLTAAEISAVSSTSASSADISAVQTSTQAATKAASTQARSTTTAKQTTTAKRETTTAAKTTTTKKPTTTAKETTTQKATTTTKRATTTTAKSTTTTVKETTTKKTTTTTRATTSAPTTNPQNNYGASGGVITEYTGSESAVSIPSSIGSDKVTAIGAGAFAGNTGIRSVSLPSTVTQIGQEAFADCTSLSSVSLPSSLELIGIGSFYGCSSLTSVSVPSGTKTISDEAFAQCTSLQTVTVPSSVTSISDNAFDGCDSLTIRCTEGSAAHDFAVANGINFSLM